MSKSFVHLHVHTEYSMLDGASRIGDVVAAAAARTASPRSASPTTATCTASSTCTRPRATRASRRSSAPSSTRRTSTAPSGPARRNSKVDDSGGEVEGGRKAYYHLTALAETLTGYRNLIQLSSRAYLEGYYQKPKVDWELLEDHHEGIIATTGCLGGQVLQALLKDDEAGALAVAGRLQDIFGRDNLFVELQDHGIADQHRTNPKLMEIARAIDAPLLATNDSHYTHQGDAMAHDALLCVQTNAKIHEENRFRFHGDQHYLKSAVEMRSLFDEVPEACDTTLWIAERADVELEFGNPVLPSFPVPEGHTETTLPARAHDRGREGALRPVAAARSCSSGSSTSSASSSRWASPRTSSIVWDIVHYAKSRGIRVGPGPGSAAGSCVAFCLRIVDIDPIKYDLLFERFLNPGRKQMPDIDMDFDSRYRGEMIKYVAQRYGADHVAQIVTFSTIKARAAVRDAARVLDYPYGLGDKIAKLMPPLIMGRDTPLHACFEKNPKFEDGYKMAADLREFYESDPDGKRVIDVAKGLEGPAPPGRHPRRRGRDHPRAAHRVPPGPAQAGAGRDDRGRADRHAVRDARGRGPRPAEDGLPRPAQPRRHRDHARARRAVHRGPARHRRHPARRPEDVRPAARGRHHRRVPARRRADARADPLGRAVDASRTSPR